MNEKIVNSTTPISPPPQFKKWSIFHSGDKRSGSFPRLTHDCHQFPMTVNHIKRFYYFDYLALGIPIACCICWICDWWSCWIAAEAAALSTSARWLLSSVCLNSNGSMAPIKPRILIVSRRIGLTVSVCRNPSRIPSRFEKTITYQFCNLSFIFLIFYFCLFSFSFYG